MIKHHPFETRLFVSESSPHADASWPSELGFTFMDFACSHTAEVPLTPSNFVGRGDYANVVLACGDNEDTASVIKMVTLPTFQLSIVSTAYWSQLYYFSMFYLHKYCIPSIVFSLNTSAWKMDDEILLAFIPDFRANVTQGSQLLSRLTLSRPL